MAKETETENLDILTTASGKNKVVEQKNSMAGISQSFDKVTSFRLTRLIIAQVERSDMDFSFYEIPVKDLAKEMGIYPSNLRKELRDNSNSKGIVKDVESHPLMIKNESGDWVRYPWFTAIGYLESKDTFRVRLNPDLAPWLLHISGNSIQYAYDTIMSVKSTLVGRTIEVLLRKLDRRPDENEPFVNAIITLEELRYSIPDIKQSYDVTMIKKRLIQPAIDALAEKEGLIISYGDVMCKRVLIGFEINLTTKKLIPEAEPGYHLGKISLKEVEMKAIERENPVEIIQKEVAKDRNKYKLLFFEENDGQQAINFDNIQGQNLDGES